MTTCYCGQPLPKGRTRYCSKACSDAHYRNMFTPLTGPSRTSGTRHKGGALPNPATHCRIDGCTEPRLMMDRGARKPWRSTLCAGHHSEHQAVLKAQRDKDPRRTFAGKGSVYTPAEIDALWRADQDKGQLFYEGRKVYGLVMQQGRYYAALAHVDGLVALPDNATLVAGNVKGKSA